MRLLFTRRSRFLVFLFLFDIPRVTSIFRRILSRLSLSLSFVRHFPHTPASLCARARQLFMKFLLPLLLPRVLFMRRPRRQPVSLVLIRYSLPMLCSHPAKSQTRLGRTKLRPLYSVSPSVVSLFAPPATSFPSPLYPPHPLFPSFCHRYPPY